MRIRWKIITCEHCGLVFKSRQHKPRFCSVECVRAYKMTTLSVQKFWAKVDKSGDCWVWTGCRNEDGYGSFNSKALCVGRAHRASYVLTYGRIPDGLQVLHKCDNPPCVRPDHLFLGTNADNVADRIAKGRKTTPGKVYRGSESRLAKLTEKQVIAIRERYSKEDVPQHQIAREMGVSQSLISMIITRHIWAHVPSQSSALIDYLKGGGR